MKTLFFIVTFACLLFFKNSFAQRITYKDLIGYWYNADQSKRKFSIEFTDSFHLIISIIVQTKKLPRRTAQYFSQLNKRIT